MRRFTRDRTNKPRRLLMGIHPVPTLVTLGNLLCGMGSIVLAMRASNPPKTVNFDPSDCIYWAAMLIFAGMLFDVMDGKVARWTKSTSRFGLEMDSLADVVSFGVAPAILVKATIDLHLPQAASAYVMKVPWLYPGWQSGQAYPLQDRYIFPLLGTYVACAALRLARYNVESETGHRDFFFGIPSPGAAGCVASLMLLIMPGPHSLFPQIQDNSEWRSQLYWPVMLAMPFIMLGLGALMVSRVLYPHVGDKLLRGRKSFMHVLVLGLLLVLAVTQTEIVLVIGFNGFMLLGLANELRYYFVPAQRPKEWIEALDQTASPEAPAAPSPDAAAAPEPHKDPPA